MIAREDFVGTIFCPRPETEMLVRKFLGEGAEGVVFGVAPLAQPDKGDEFLKFSKPQPFLEMDVLHHSFRVHEKLYPTHRLLMSPAKRLKLLADEMLQRVQSPHFEFRVSIFRHLIENVLMGLAFKYSNCFAEGRFHSDMLLQDPLLVPRLDDNLIYRLQELLDEDNIADEYVPFSEYFVQSTKELISRLKDEGRYFPFSSNVLYNLVGLELADFINNAELSHIASDHRLGELVASTDLNSLLQLVKILYHRAGDILARLPNEPAKGAEASPAEVELAGIRRQVEIEARQSEVKSCIGGALSALTLVYSFSSKFERDTRKLRGLSLYWIGKVCGYTQGNEQFSRESFENALGLLTEPDELRDRHDLLLDLSSLLKDKEADAALAYMRQAHEIKERLRS